ncbi:hypothetical protein [Pararobbsia alpina]|uniref:Uncharacterized protein n=1 Tax=Pararobbsia alpina TaxID=621374 RepID=A0A6S7BV73_9BURK|nr:hypothetical protein [Pararobbsia alpina]CAB3803901.1 hypothetical protein LMG28138_05423 [Pararobbsia alpina]
MTNENLVVKPCPKCHEETNVVSHLRVGKLLAEVLMFAIMWVFMRLYAHISLSVGRYFDVHMGWPLLAWLVGVGILTTVGVARAQGRWIGLASIAGAVLGMSPLLATM